MVCLGSKWIEVGFTFLLFWGGGGGSEILLEQVRCNFGFWNKFIIVLPFGLLLLSRHHSISTQHTATVRLSVISQNSSYLIFTCCCRVNYGYCLMMNVTFS